MLTPADSRRGEQFTPSLTPDELAFHDAVAHNESAGGCPEFRGTSVAAPR
jgi:hypothetical protein